MSLAAGIDLSARRGLDLALLEDGTRLLALEHLPDVPATVCWLRTHAPVATIGIDAPQGPRLPLMTGQAPRAALDPPPPPGRYQHHRLCDYHLARRGIALYLTPAAGEPVPGWIATGFALFAALRAHGLRSPHHAHDYTAPLLEVYPYSVFVTLLGYLPPPKSGAEGLAIRRAALYDAGVRDLPRDLGHDTLDAVAAAVGAAAFAGGAGCALGHPEEGYMILPIAEQRLLARYQRR